MVPMRDGVALATDVYRPAGAGRRGVAPGDPRPPAVRQVRPLHLHARDRRIPDRARLRRRDPGRARQVPLRGRAGAVRPRGRRRLRHDRLDRCAAVELGCGRHDRRPLLRLHPTGGRRLRPPGAEGDRAARHRQQLHQGLLRTRPRAEAVVLPDAGLRRHLAPPTTCTTGRCCSTRPGPTAAAAGGPQSSRWSGSWEHAMPAADTERIYGGDPTATISIKAPHVGGWWDNLSPWQLADWHAASTAPAAAHQFLRMGAIDHEDFHLVEFGETACSTTSKDDDRARRPSAAGARRADLASSTTTCVAAEASGKPHASGYEVARRGWEEADAWPPPGRSATQHGGCSPVSRAGARLGRRRDAAPRGRGRRRRRRWAGSTIRRTRSRTCTSQSGRSSTTSPTRRRCDERSDVATFTVDPAGAFAPSPGR